MRGYSCADRTPEGRPPTRQPTAGATGTPVRRRAATAAVARRTTRQRCPVPRFAAHRPGNRPPGPHNRDGTTPRRDAAARVG